MARNCLINVSKSCSIVPSQTKMSCPRFECVSPTNVSQRPKSSAFRGVPFYKPGNCIRPRLKPCTFAPGAFYVVSEPGPFSVDRRSRVIDRQYFTARAIRLNKLSMVPCQPRSPQALTKERRTVDEGAISFSTAGSSTRGDEESTCCEPVGSGASQSC